MNGREAMADFGGVTKKISLGILEHVKLGDNVLIHAGFAIGKVTEEEAQNAREALKELKKVMNEQE